MPIKAKLGGKITDSHTTMTETSAEVVHVANKLSEVTKIGLGEIRHVPGGRRDIKFSAITGGIKATVRGNGAVHQIFIYTKSPNEVMRAVETNFRKSP
ncbi:MAG: hypothetical protein P4L61_01950 [Candidatus Pacebacteria bacterium]|nr:hypothetical protein [Candidatus Paceibacterota bacterium]